MEQNQDFSLPKSLVLFLPQFIGLELFRNKKYMSRAFNCIFVVNVLQFILSELILCLNFVKQKESLLGEKSRCWVCPPSIAFFFYYLYNNKGSNKMLLLPPHYFNSFVFQSVVIFLRKLHYI